MKPKNDELPDDYWERYEAEKRKISDIGLTHTEYERAIDDLVKRLGI